ncbi:7190_t:CDS:2 [Funneliformis geosporum]|uniref:7190_t:CDS:1 n=1 Tax=Funneliformis geosporum TaxID=1117311 RepID=A0A9W4STV0_9GLOM|nr:7190_t:CDS:2 [Funneliformis geosporum]
MHYLRSCVDHNHGPQASNAEVAKITAQIKRQAFETRDKPAKIIQDNIISMPKEIHLYIPSVNALRRTIRRVRRLEMPPQPQNISEDNNFIITFKIMILSFD